MTDAHEWVPDGVDVTIPDASRVYDYALGGVHNFEVDREFWDRTEAAFPGAAQLARANRGFLGRAVRWLSARGIRQFVDIGSGIPTLGNVHEAAQDANPDARVVYVDIDPIAVQQSRALLDGNPYATVIQGDLRDPDDILGRREVLDLIDFAQPVAVLTLAVLHFIHDSDNPAGIVDRLGRAMTSGSYLVLSHFGPDPSPVDAAAQEKARQLYEKTPTPVVMRTPAELRAIIGDGFEIVEPGVVPATDWHPDPDEAGDPPTPSALVAVARRR